MAIVAKQARSDPKGFSSPFPDHRAFSDGLKRNGAHGCVPPVENRLLNKGSKSTGRVTENTSHF